jgi:hypothetical protein
MRWKAKKKLRLSHRCDPLLAIAHIVRSPWPSLLMLDTPPDRVIGQSKFRSLVVCKETL